MALSDVEKETILRYDKSSDLATVYTHERRIIARLKKELKRLEAEGGRLVREGKYEGTPYAEFVVPVRWIKVSPPRRVGSRKGKKVKQGE
jgi:hypothetical protein